MLSEELDSEDVFYYVQMTESHDDARSLSAYFLSHGKQAWPEGEASAPQVTLPVDRGPEGLAEVDIINQLVRTWRLFRRNTDAGVIYLQTQP